MKIHSARHFLPYFSVGIILLAVVWGASHWVVAAERKDRHEQAKLDVERAARGFAEHVTLTLQYTDVYLKTARDLYGQNGVAAVTDLLERVPLNRSIVSHLTIIDETGTPLLVSGFEIKPGTTAKDRDYFKFHKSNPVDSVFISLPKKGRNSGIRLIRMVRRLTTSDGRFAGVIFGAIDVEQVARYFDTLNLGPQSAATVIGMDKKVRVHAGSRENYDYSESELDYGDSIVWQMFETSPVGLYEGIGPIDGASRLSAFRRLSDYPLAVVVGVSLANVSRIVGSYQRTAYITGAVIFILLVVLIVLMFQEARTAQQLREAKAGLQDEVAAQTSALCEEIEERKSVERALQWSEARLKDFAEASSDWFWEMDEDCRFSYFSDRFTEVTGVPQEALLGKTREETGIPGVDPEQWEKHLANLAARRSFRGFEHPRTLPDGRVVYLSINGMATFDKEGRFKGYRGTGSDITEQKIAENLVQRAKQELERRVEERTKELRRVNVQLREEEAKLREILENSPVGVAIVSHNIDGTRLTGDRLFVNSAMVQMFGATSRESLINAKIEDSWVDKEQLKAVEDISKSRGELVNFEVQRRRMDGTLWWVSMNTRPIRFNGQDCTMVWNFDITERVQAEEQLRQSQKMEAVGQLTGGVAHDFNNLLAVILGNAELLSVKAEKDDPKIQSVIRAATRGAVLTQRLLAFSRKQTLQPQAVDLNALVSGMIDLLGRTLGETIEIKTSFALGLWRAKVDTGLLENALVNLAINGRDAMPGGGTVVIETGNVSLDEAYAHNHSDVTPGDYVMLAVSDSGSGMSAEVLEHAFEPFFTTKEVGEGSGLGLAMVYGFVMQSGGHIAIYSEEGHGTTVKVYLPRTVAEAARAGEKTATEAPRAMGETVLMVEDDVDVRRLAVAMLEDLGYQVLQAPDGWAALSVLEEESVPPDLLLSDVVLPRGLSGPDLAENVQRELPAVKVLFMSGYAEYAVRYNGLAGNGVELLNKPFSKQELALKVRGVLDR